MIVRKLPLSAPQIPTADESVASDAVRKSELKRRRSLSSPSSLATRRSLSASPSVLLATSTLLPTGSQRVSLPRSRDGSLISARPSARLPAAPNNSSASGPYSATAAVLSTPSRLAEPSTSCSWPPDKAAGSHQVRRGEVDRDRGLRAGEAAQSLPHHVAKEEGQEQRRHRHRQEAGRAETTFGDI